MLRAATGESDWQGLAEACVEASIAAGVTLTGAFDDQVAVLRGGAHLTDNRALRVLESFAPPRWHVAIWVPEQVIAKASLRGLDASRLRDYVAVPRSAQQLPEAMTQNGRAFHAFYAAHGLPVSDAPARVALDAGALGAGLSGTGPAVAAIFDEPADLPAVAGGEWLWTRVAR
jgi:shikimate kinase